jgi:hypothetical protein
MTSPITTGEEIGSSADGYHYSTGTGMTQAWPHTPDLDVPGPRKRAGQRSSLPSWPPSKCFRMIRSPSKPRACGIPPMRPNSVRWSMGTSQSKAGVSIRAMSRSTTSGLASIGVQGPFGVSASIRRIRGAGCFGVRFDSLIVPPTSQAQPRRGVGGSRGTGQASSVSAGERPRFADSCCREESSATQRDLQLWCILAGRTKKPQVHRLRGLGLQKSIRSYGRWPAATPAIGSATCR